MSQKQTISINGRDYDIVTGLPIQKEQPQSITPRSTMAATSRPQRSQQPAQTSHALHTTLQRSTMLNRAFVKKKPTTQTVHPIQSTQNATTQHAVRPITKTAVPVTQKAVKPKTVNPAITRHSGQRIDGVRPITSRGSAARANLALAQANANKKRTVIEPINAAPIVSMQPPAAQPQEKPMTHPIIDRVHQKHADKHTQVASQSTPSASIIKQAAINEALSNAPKPTAKQHKQKSKRGRLFSLVSGFAALVLFAGYLTYLNVPNLSVRVAAAQAGIDASYPGYQPDGYKLSGPVAFSDGEVRMQFAAKTGESNYTLKESRSSWDSNALLENYVKDRSNNNYVTSQEKGVTIYSFDGNAAWVNGGILYTISGNTQLSPDQIRKIATSV